MSALDDDYKDFLGDNAAERFLAQVVASVLVPFVAWFSVEHTYSLFLQERTLDGLLAIPMYGFTLLGVLAYFLSERDAVEPATLRFRYALRVIFFLGSLAGYVVLWGPVCRLTLTARQENITVFLSQQNPKPGETVRALIRISFPRRADLCDMTQVELLTDSSDSGTVVFTQPGFYSVADNQFFTSACYGGGHCRLGFRVPEGFDRNTARFRITYMEAVREFFTMIDVKEGSAVRTVPLYGRDSRE